MGKGFNLVRLKMSTVCLFKWGLGGQCKKVWMVVPGARLLDGSWVLIFCSLMEDCLSQGWQGALEVHLKWDSLVASLLLLLLLLLLAPNGSLYIFKAH